MGKPGKINSQRWSPKTICGCVFFQIEAEDDEVVVSDVTTKNVRPFAVHAVCDEHTFGFEPGTHGRAISGDVVDPYAYIGWLWHVGAYRVLRERRVEFRRAEDTLTGVPLALRLFNLQKATTQFRSTMLEDLPEKRLWGGVDAAALRQTLDAAVQGMVGDQAAPEWPYSVPADPQAPAAKAEPAAGYEAAFTSLHSTVHNEDRRRSTVIQIIAVTLGITAPDDESLDKAIREIATFAFTLDRLPGTDERVLEVTIAGMTKPQRNSVVGAADVQFGVGAVLVL